MRPNSFLLVAFATGLAACSGGPSGAPAVVGAPLLLETVPTEGESPVPPGEPGGQGGFSSISEFMKSKDGGFGPGGVTVDHETGTLIVEQDGETFVFDIGNPGGTPPEGTPAFENTPPAFENTPPAFENTPPAIENTPPAIETTPPGLENIPPAFENTPPGFENIPVFEDIPVFGDVPPFEGDGATGGQGGNGHAGWIFFFLNNPNAPDHFIFDEAPGIPGNAGNALKNRP